MDEIVSIAKLWNLPKARALAKEASNALAGVDASPNPPAPSEEELKGIDDFVRDFSEPEDIVPEFET